MTVHDFYVKLSNVDWLYSMSDSPGTWDRGRKQVAETREMAESLGEVYEQMFHDFREYYSSIVTGPNLTKPLLSNYEQDDNE